MSNPIVSIVMPVWNKQNTLGQSIQSIVDQSFKDWELIIVDDASTDDSQKMLSEIFVQDIFNKKKIKKETRIKRVFLPTNVGVVEAYRQGIYKAKGKYIMFHDSDDMSMPDRVEKCLKHIGDNDIIYHGIYIIARHPTLPITSRQYRPPKKWVKDKIYTEQYIPGIIFAKAELLKKVKFPKEARGAWDWMHHILLHQMGAKYTCINEGLYEYYRFPDSSLSYQNELTGKRQEAMKWIQEWLIKNKIVPKNHKFGRGFKGYYINKKAEKLNLLKEDL